jgi:uroporphyrinogen-III synthase
VAPSPTTDGIIAALRSVPLTGKTVGVQLYRQDNEPLHAFLEGAGAKVRAVTPYVYAPASEAEKVAGLISNLQKGPVDAVVFTSSPQVERLFEVAVEQQLEQALEEGLRRVKVAAVGPVVADALRHRSAPVHICPEQGFVMKNLVQLIKRELGT